MTPDAIANVRADFSVLARDADGFVIRFYETLFLLDPTLRTMFPADLSAQRGKLVQALAMVVASLDRFDRIAGAVADLGRRHGGYGVTPEHYDLVGAALLLTIEERLGCLTEASRAAWTAAYGALAGTMIAAAGQQQAAAQ